MVLLRVLGGLLAATVVGLILGAVKDYLELWPDAAFKFVWPLGMGAAAFAGALVMALLKPSRIVAGGGKAALPVQSTRSSHHGKHAGAAGISSDVPGMPTFDFDKARSAGSAMEAAEHSGAPALDKPKEQA